MAREFDFIRWLQSQQTSSSNVVIPIGDDLAAMRWDAGDLLLAGADQVMDGVHFDSSIHSPREIGRKVMNRNLSDCAAMACLPAAAVVTVALPASASIDYAQQLYLGLRDAADRFDCPIVGGDTGTWPGKLVLSVAILGRSAGVTPIIRNGAKHGDHIFVTGPLGGSILGRHMTFEPRIQLARMLAGTGHLTAMLDLSDGLSRDITHICNASQVGAKIDAALVPIHVDVHKLPKDELSPVQHALHDGEDYELLFTASADAMPGATRIGTVTHEPGVFLVGDREIIPLRPAGWEHRL